MTTTQVRHQAGPVGAGATRLNIEIDTLSWLATVGVIALGVLSIFYDPTVLSNLLAGIAHAADGVTDGTGDVPSAAGDVFGSWDGIVSGNVIPLGSLAVGIAAVFGGIRAGSGGLIGGGVIGVCTAILVSALPAIVTETTDGATWGMGMTNTGFLLPITPFTLPIYALVHYVRNRRRSISSVE